MMHILEATILFNSNEESKARLHEKLWRRLQETTNSVQESCWKAFNAHFLSK